jgi:hypothetical protein
MQSAPVVDGNEWKVNFFIDNVIGSFANDADGVVNMAFFHEGRGGGMSITGAVGLMITDGP